MHPTRRKHLLTGALLAAFAVAGQAQPAPAAAGASAAPQARHHFDPAKRAERVNKHLAELKQKLQLSQQQEPAWTSFSTAMVSSAVVLLRQAANLQGGAAVRPETLKAVLLAGATKEEFPGWSHTVTTPLDPVFGAGELEISNSWFILAGQGQAANLTTPRPDFAWSSTTLTTTTTAD